jgi:hypothetical protein
MKSDLTIIASGNSLRGFDFDQIPGTRWAINYTAKQLHEAGIRIDRALCFDKRMPDYPKELYYDTIVPHFGRWHNRGEKLNREPMQVGNLNHSVAFAINVALQEGYKNIIVLGADQQGDKHWYSPEDFSYKWNFELFDLFFKIISKGLFPGEVVTLVESACKHLPSISMNQYKTMIGYEG